MRLHLLNKILFHFTDYSACSSRLLVSPLRSITDHDRMGGHTLARHVSIPVPDLKQRLVDDPGITASSRFWSNEAASASFCYLVNLNLQQLLDWLVNPTTRTNPVRKSFSDSIPPMRAVGYTVQRASPDAVLPCRDVRIVLHKRSQTDFHLVTMFPTR